MGLFVKRRDSLKEREFNLCQEPWICVIGQDYRTENVNLKDVLIHAEKYRGLAGETESQNIAMLRFLLAVVHTVFSREDENGDPIPIDSTKEARRRWKALWDTGKFPKAPISEYLSKWEDRFWLFDPDHPFYQAPGIDGTTNPAKKMNGALVESSNKTQLFSLRSGEKKDELDYDEAARWLIYIQSFGDTAAKKPSPKLCHTGSLGIVVAKGNSLFETLMLNLTLLKDGMELWGEARPAWERKKPSVEKLKQVPVSDNLPELFTMQCRRIFLHRDQGVVTEYAEAAGEYMEEESAFSEQMTFWKKRKIDKETEGFYPKTHDKSRQMWRDFSVLLGNTNKVPKPGVVAWVTMLQNKKMLPKGRFVMFETVGIEYGNMYCGVADEFSDALEMHTSLLDDLGKTWQTYIVQEIERCDQLAEAVGMLGMNLDKASGGDGSSKERAKEQAYYRLDMPFRQWLLQVDPEQELEEQTAHRKAWRETAIHIIRNLGQELVEQAGTAALVGRTVTEKVKNKEVKRRYSSPEAFNYFLYQLNKIKG
jgi:CRISPR system Cascade subunit CasA